MPDGHPWKSEARQLDHRTIKVRLMAEAPQTFAEVIGLLESSAEFRSFFTRSIQEAGYDSYFWEVPPVTSATVNQPFEFVVVEGASLEFLRPDPKPFAEHFAARAGASRIVAVALAVVALLVAFDHPIAA